MVNKSTKPRVPGISDAALLRPRVLKYLIELTDATPPLGERYEELLKDLIFQAYQQANGDLGEAEPAFLNEIFHYVASYGPMEDYFNEPQISEIMINGPSQIFIEQHGKLILTETKYESEIQLRFVKLFYEINRFLAAAQSGQTEHAESEQRRSSTTVRNATATGGRGCTPGDVRKMH